MKWRQFNWIMFGAMLVLIVIGTIAIWSAGNARAEAVFHGMWVNNLITAVVGLGLYFVLALNDYRKTLEYFSLPCYILAIVLLIAVLIFGDMRFGGRRWIFGFQPSEISKLFVIAMIAEVFGRKSEFRASFGGFMLAVVLLGVPSLLILAEPDLGTALTLVPAVVLMMFASRVWRKGLIIIAAVGAILAMSILGAVYEAEKPGTSAERRNNILRMLPLKDHQIRRVKVFLFPDSDPMGSGYTLRQAKITIGSGGYAGKGLGKGEANHLKYLPQSISMNDFIFCVYAEEMGYVGSMILLALFALILLPCCYIAFISGDARGRLIALGVGTLIFAHVYINIAMSIGLVPITGLPLPFISSGRTFLVTVMCALGLVQSVSLHREV